MRIFFEIPGLNIYLQIIVTILSIVSHLIRVKKEHRKESAMELAVIYTIGLSGWFGIMSGLFGHIIYANEVASGIGWPLDSGFQMELGFAAIGIGIIGFIGFWKQSFWLPFIIAKTTFMWGAGATHILHIIRNANLSPSNTGVVLYWDLIFPFILIGLYLAVRKRS